MNWGRSVLVVLAMAALFISGCAGLSFSKLKADFIALRYAGEAMEIIRRRPLNRTLALAKIDRALTLAPNEPVIIATAPSVYIAVGAYDRAAALLLRQPNPDPTMLGQCLLALGRKEEGVGVLLAAYQKAEELWRLKQLSPFAYAMTLNNTGYVLADAGVRLDLAKQMLEVATRILPLEYNCVDSLGWVYYRLGDLRKAIFYLERAVRLQPKPGEPEIIYHLGAAYARAGRHAQATKMLRLALRLDPGHEQALQELRRLRWLLPTPQYV